jgi:hypothetical protein
MDAIHTSRGKWSRPGIPHRGWTCIGIEDLGEPAEVCEMCESVDIRYVHSMEHPDFPEVLGVGCVCAEHMEEDYVAPKRREKRLRSAARRRLTWGRRTWSLSFANNFYLNTEGFNLTVYPARLPQKGWRIAVTHRDSGKRREGQRLYGSSTEAQMASLDALLWAKDRIASTEAARTEGS